MKFTAKTRVILALSPTQEDLLSIGARVRFTATGLVLATVIAIGARVQSPAKTRQVILALSPAQEDLFVTTVNKRRAPAFFRQNFCYYRALAGWRGAGLVSSNLFFYICHVLAFLN